MKKIKSFLLWFLTNVVTFLFLYWGIFCGIKGAQNVFMGWFFIQALSLSTFLSKEILALNYKKRGPFCVPSVLMNTVEISIIGILLWGGFFVTAFLSFWAWTMILLYNEYAKAQIKNG